MVRGNLVVSLMGLGRVHLHSSLSGAALPADSVYFGEVSLSGAARPVAHAVQRLREAEKLGFSAATVPSASADLPKSGIAVRAVETLSDLVAHVAAGSASLSDED